MNCSFLSLNQLLLVYFCSINDGYIDIHFCIVICYTERKMSKGVTHFIVATTTYIRIFFFSKWVEVRLRLITFWFSLVSSGAGFSKANQIHW